jgi:hypothetical protein
MRKGLIAALLLGLLPAAAVADGSFLRFDGGIGVIPVSSGVGQEATAEVVNRNIVRGVQPPGQIWVIADLDAKIADDGHIRVRGKGLLLGGGNNVGLNGNASVFATLICETAAPFVERSTDLAGVPLEADGDFRIDDVLSPWPPAGCATPVLLIRNAANRAWFAAGIPRHDDGEHGD